MKNNHHIDIVVKYFYPVTAGIETNVIETYSRLAEEGWDITVHTSNDVYTEKNALKSSETLRGLDVKRYPFTKTGYWPSINWETSDLICLHNFDIFPHFRVLAYALYRKSMGKRTPKIILTPHGGYTPEWRVFPQWQRPIKKLYHFSLGAWLINAVVDKVRAVSEWEAEEIKKNHVRESLVTVISNGVEDEAYITDETEVSAEMKEKVAALGNYIIQIGRVYPIKNYETALKALVSVPKDVRYVIAGPIADKQYYQDLQDLIVELGLQERVLFLGVVKGLDKYYLIRHAQMMVHMAIWESFCNVIHEGLSQGLVCLVADNTALPYLIKDNVNGFCIPTKDSTGLAEKINLVLRDAKTARFDDMRKRNREFGLQESWRSVSQKMDELYKKTLRS